MTRYLFQSVILIILLLSVHQQINAQQIDIDRIEMMPNMPQPYEMRDWKSVARRYDSLVFNLEATGQYLPLTTIIENTINYPEHPSFGIQSYVGSNSLPGQEAINLIPAVVGATLAGIDKSDQSGYNWALMCEEFFNKRPEENVYLNNPVASSGDDWWYETMPNVFFYQMNYLYPGTGDFDYQFVTVADRWLEAVEAMGGDDTPWNEAYMNYRAFDLSSMTPLVEGVKEPEAAGAIAWILYQAYHVTMDSKYRKGAEWAMEFLDGWNTNPAYELQLSYGAYMAARMNAELSTTYDLEKIMNWCFDIGPLRQWGAIVERWGGQDVQGLIGEAVEEYEGYAFNMNGTEQAGALVPLVRYDDRFARAIGKWTLNVANATRLFYSAYLPDDMEDNEDWTEIYDLHSVIAYEALRENIAGPYGTGDAMSGNWAETNLGLYGSSHVGILGALIDTTDVPGILKLDLLATDYYHDDAYPSYLIYNPYEEEKTVVVHFTENPFDIYDAISNQVIITNALGSTSVTIPSDSPVIAVLIPCGSIIEYDLNKALVNGIVIDYNSGNPVANYPPRIKSVAVSDTLVLTGAEISLFCTATDRETVDLTYLWESEDVIVGSESQVTVTAPPEPAILVFKCTITDEGGLQAADSITVDVVETINYPPEIELMTVSDKYMELGDTAIILCRATDPNGDSLSYMWTADGGSIQGNDSTAAYTAPDIEGIYIISCTVTDTAGASVSKNISVLVNNPGSGQTGNLVASYEFAGNLLDQSGYGNDGAPVDVEYVDDMHGNPSQSLSFPSSTSMVRVENSDILNFREGLSFTGWIYIDNFFDRESYIVSHGNWNNRWKISLGDHTLRFTLNGEAGIIDLDINSLLEVDRWYHLAAIYDGTFCQLYLDGSLDAFAQFQGKINTTTYDLVMGQSLPGQTGFDFKGKLDKVKIFNYGISHEKVLAIFEEESSEIYEDQLDEKRIHVFPNPASDVVNLVLNLDREIRVDLNIIRLDGSSVYKMTYLPDKSGATITIPVKRLSPGIYLLLISNGMTLFPEKLVIIR
ncbi:MAG: laminin G [Bacteroidetes bacterium]|nr:laminin G [Bacteroidota bacterium]